MGNTSIRTALYECLLLDLSAVIETSYLPAGPDGPELGMLSPDATVRQHAAVSLARSLVKKFQDEIDGPTAEARAQVKFLDANDHCASWKPPAAPLGNESLSDSFDAELYGQWAWMFRKFWNSCEFDAHYDNLRDEYPFLDWDEVLDATKIAFFADVGPGAVVSGSGGSFLEKFSGVVSYQGPLAPRLWRLKCSNPRYRDVEFYLQLSPSSGFEEVRSSKMLFVPKTVREHRSICVEPSLNMFFQQGVRFLLEERLKSHFGIDLAIQQDRNRALAMAGSLDGSYGTIDLTSASDTIAYQLMKNSIPASQFSLLDGLRSKSATLPNGTELELQMFSTMGNAFTFPLMTAIFAAVVEASYQLLGIPFRKGRHANWAVNGDDIIVEAKAYDTVTRLLSILGFVPNLSKSFNEGFFRESCGVDAFKGRDIRGVYIKTLKSPQDAISALNRLVGWSAEWDIPLPNTCAFLRNKCKRSLFLVPFHESDVAGLRVPFDALPPKTERKWISLSAARRQLSVIPYRYWEVKPDLLPVHGDVAEEDGGGDAQDPRSGYPGPRHLCARSGVHRPRRGGERGVRAADRDGVLRP